MLRFVVKTIKAFNSDINPGQIALAGCLGMALGLTPYWAFHSWLIVLFVLVVRVHLGMFLVSWGVFKLVGLGLDGPLDALGEALLAAPALQGLWGALYRSSFWRMTEFNNTALLGSFVVAAVAFVPMLLLLRFLILKYRERIAEYVRKSRVLKLVKANKLYRAYAAIR